MRRAAHLAKVENLRDNRQVSSTIKLRFATNRFTQIYQH